MHQRLVIVLLVLCRLEAAAAGLMCQSRATRTNQTPPLVHRQRGECCACQTRLKESEAQRETNNKARLVEFFFEKPDVTILKQKEEEVEVKTRTGSTSRR